MSRIDRLPCLLARSIKADTVVRCINCLFATRPLTAQISSTGWSGCVYVLHSLPSTSTRTATRNLSFIKTQQSWPLVIIVPARARTRPFPSSAAPTERASERPCGLSNETDPTGRIRFRVQSHFGLGVSLKCLYNLEIQNYGIPLFLTISCVLFFIFCHSRPRFEQF